MSLSDVYDAPPSVKNYFECPIQTKVRDKNPVIPKVQIDGKAIAGSRQ